MATAIAAWVVIAGGAAAQTSDEENDTGTPGDSRLLETITVTATRNPIEAFQYPGMVTVIGRERIETLQPSTPDDILRFVPGVEFTGGPRRTGEVPTIRGFEGEDVLVLFDGARQNFNSGHDGRFFIDPSLLRQVEVLRGPASALYGSGGLGGVIEFRTVRASDFLAPGETAGAFASTGYQTVDREIAGTVTGYGRPAEGLDLLLSLTGRSSGSIELSDGSELSNSDDDILSGLAKLSYDFADFHTVEASFLRFQNDATEPNNGQGNNIGSDELVDKDIVSDTYRVAYSYSNPGDTLLDLDVLAYYSDIQADEERLVTTPLGPAGELLRRDVDTYGFRLDNRSRLRVSDSVMTTFTYGGEYYRDEQDGGAGSGERGGVPDAEADFYGIFAQAEIAITEPLGFVPGDLLIIPGARFDDFEASSDIAEDNSDNELSPRIAISYLPTDWLMVFGSYTEAFRAPSFDELFQEGTHFNPPPNVFVPNPNLRPQRTQTWEFGGGFSFDDVLAARDRFEIKGSYYETDADDFIELDVDIFGGTSTSVNVPNATLRGAEIEAVYESDRFLLSLGFSRIDGENEDTNEKLGTLQPNQYTADFAVKLPEYDSLVGWRLQAAEEFDNVDPGRATVPGHGVNDIYYAWTPSSGPLQGLRLDLGVDNVFDQEYRRVTDGAGIVEEGRNYKAQISYRINW